MTPIQIIEEERKKIIEVLNFWFPPNVDALTLDGDSRSMRERIEDSITFLLLVLTKEETAEINKKLENIKEYQWRYGGGGGYDTEHWCCRGVCEFIPGIKQIAYYGIKNEKWWAKYLFKWQVIMPDKYKDDGKIEALTTLLQEKQELLNYLEKI